MKHWINKNYKTLIVAAFLIPIMTVAVVSISHVTKWYGISNPMSWSIYLSVGIEIAALSALAAISANMGKKVYFPFAVVTIVQFIGNIFFAYSYIDINAKSFKDWVELVSPILEIFGVDPTDPIGHKRFLAFFAGGMLPIISLSFLHMLVKFTEEDRKSEIIHDIDDKLNNKVEASEIISEVSRLRLSDEDLEILSKHLENPLPPNEHLKTAAKKYQEKNKSEEIITPTPQVIEDTVSEEIYPSLSDEEIMEMNQQEYERTLEVPEDEFDGFLPEPFATPEEVEKYNIDEIAKVESTENDEPIYQSETKEIDEIINVVDTAIDENEPTKEEEEEKKKVEDEYNFSNVGTHVPVFYKFGPGVPTVMPDPTPSPEVDDLYWEKDDVNPNHLIYDLENDKTIIPQSEDEMTITPTNNFGPQIKVRNVSDTQYRNNR